MDLLYRSSPRHRRLGSPLHLRHPLTEKILDNPNIQWDTVRPTELFPPQQTPQYGINMGV